MGLQPARPAAKRDHMGTGMNELKVNIDTTVPVDAVPVDGDWWLLRADGGTRIWCMEYVSNGFVDRTRSFYPRMDHCRLVMRLFNKGQSEFQNMIKDRNDLKWDWMIERELKSK